MVSEPTQVVKLLEETYICRFSAHKTAQANSLPHYPFIARPPRYSTSQVHPKEDHLEAPQWLDRLKWEVPEAQCHLVCKSDCAFLHISTYEVVKRRTNIRFIHTYIHTYMYLTSKIQ
jgi:hypothetical protein